MRGIRGLFTVFLLSGLGWSAAQAEDERASPAASLTLAAVEAGTGLSAASKGHALHAAAIYNRPKAAKLLVARGMPVDMRNEGGLTPLMVAATFGNVEVAEVLIAAGADLTLRNPAGHAALHIAALAGQAPVAQLLLAHGADSAPRAEAHGETPLHFAALLGRAKVIAVLAAHGAPLDATDNDGLTPLQYARRRLQMRAVDALTQLGARVDGLHDAVNAGDVARVVELIAKGANVNALDLFGTPLHLAAAKGRTGIAVILIDRGADLEASGEPEGAHPLHTAALNGEDEVAALLIERGAKVDARDVAGRTPLMVAAGFLKPDVARLLLAQGADVRAMDSASGDTPIHYAACSDDLETARLLLRHGADVNARSGGNGATPLHYAAGKGEIEMVALLLEEGGQPGISDKAGWTPYTTASNGRHDQVAQWLRSLADGK
jgi:uncharacterized protein